MNVMGIACAIVAAGLMLAAPAQAQLAKRADANLAPQLAEALAGNAANYRIALRGEMEMGVAGSTRTLRPIPAIGRVTLNAITPDGLVVRVLMQSSTSVTRTGPDHSVFRKGLQGASRYVTGLDIAQLEIIYSVDWSMWRLDQYTNLVTRPEPWTLERVRLRGTIYRKDPLTGRESVVEERWIMDIRPMAEMRYGLWSLHPPTSFDTPAAIKTVPGYMAVQLLTGEDGMKANPAVADILLDRAGGPIRRSMITPELRNNQMPPHVFWNYDGFSNVPDLVQWNQIGRVGLFYRYGEHGLERDDWDVEAVLVGFCPEAMGTVCYRKETHYLPQHARLVRLNGDRPGTEVWAPFLAGR